MRGYIIKRPKFMDGIEQSRHNPRTLIACLITLAIYFIYNIAGSIVGGVYFGMEFAKNPGMLSGSFDEMMQTVYDMLLSQPMMIILLFSFIFIIVMVVILVKAIHKRKLRTIGFVGKGSVVQYMIGIGFGALLLFVQLIPTILNEYDNIAYLGFSNLVIVFLFAFLIQSAAEEILFRGYLFTTVTRRIGILWASVVSSALFALLHVFNPGVNFLAILSIMLLGVFLCFYMVRTNNIWGACGIHFAWNFLQGTFSELDLGGAKLDYRIIEFKGVSFEPDTTNFFGSPADIVPIAIILAAIAIVLLVGKNRIAIKKPMNDEIEY